MEFRPVEGMFTETGLAGISGVQGLAILILGSRNTMERPDTPPSADTDDSVQGVCVRPTRERARSVSQNIVLI